MKIYFFYLFSYCFERHKRLQTPLKAKYEYSYRCVQCNGIYMLKNGLYNEVLNQSQQIQVIQQPHI